VQQIGEGHRLKLSIDHEGRSYELLFDDDYLAGGRVFAHRVGPDGSRRGGVALGHGPASSLDALNDLLELSATVITPRGTEAVIVPIAFFYPRQGDHGRLVLGGTPLGPALAAVAIGGVEEATSLMGAGASLHRAFPAALNGLWVRGQWPGADLNSSEVLVASVEEQLAEAHGLPIGTVRERLRTEIGGVLVQAHRDSFRDWHFVRRTSQGEPVVLQTHSHYDSPAPERAPYAYLLRAKRVAVIGCGAVGWTVATLLARSGVRQFTLFDDDRVQGSNLPRLGTFLGSTGRFKVDALAAQLEAVASGIEVTAAPHLVGGRVGALALVDAKPDLLLNLTAEEISTDETNRAALVSGQPAIFAWVSNGVGAGRIFRVRPFASACYECVRDSEPAPIDSVGFVPVGNELPWTGSVIDVDAFAANVAQMAIRTLRADPVSPANPDHIVLDFAGLVPTATSVLIKRDHACAECGR
jgi:molybdopterin/thiamine biosynthesis adenylyltransferase